MTKTPKHASGEMVMAWDGKANVPTPARDVVQIQASGIAIDMDQGTLVTPRVRRALFCQGIDRLPCKLLKIEPPGTPRLKTILKERPDGTRFYDQELVPLNHWHLELEYPEPCISTLAGMTSVWSIAVVNEADARDTYFADLPSADRDAILSAVLR